MYTCAHTHACMDTHKLESKTKLNYDTHKNTCGLFSVVQLLGKRNAIECDWYIQCYCLEKNDFFLSQYISKADASWLWVELGVYLFFSALRSVYPITVSVFSSVFQSCCLCMILFSCSHLPLPVLTVLTTPFRHRFLSLKGPVL